MVQPKSQGKKLFSSVLRSPQIRPTAPPHRQVPGEAVWPSGLECFLDFSMGKWSSRDETRRVPPPNPTLQGLVVLLEELKEVSLIHPSRQITIPTTTGICKMVFPRVNHLLHLPCLSHQPLCTFRDSVLCLAVGERVGNYTQNLVSIHRDPISHEQREGPEKSPEVNEDTLNPGVCTHKTHL